MSAEFSLTEAAATRINYLLSQEQESANLMLRISVSGGGCSGFQYHFSFDDQALAEDQIFEKQDAKVVVDETSLQLLSGSTLDFVEDLAASMFVITNPQASTRCGCGNSFSI